MALNSKGIAGLLPAESRCYTKLGESVETLVFAAWAESVEGSLTT